MTNKTLILDLETTWSIRDRYTGGEWKKVSDKGSPFTQKNRVVCGGTYDISTNEYKLWDLDTPDGAKKTKDFITYINSFDHIVGHNIKFDVHWLQTLGLDPSKFIIDDTLITEYVLNGGQKTLQHLGLDKVAPLYGGEKKIDIVKKMWESGVNTQDIPKSILHKYLYHDVWNTYKVWVGQKTHKKALPQEANIKFARALNKVTQSIEWEGMAIDEAEAKAILTRFEDMLKSQERLVHSMIQGALPEGVILNPKSPKEMLALVYSVRMPTKEDFGGDKTKADKNKAEWKTFISGFKPYFKDAGKELEKAISKHFVPVDYGFKIKPHPKHVGVSGPSVGKKAMEAMIMDGTLEGEAKDFIENYLLLNGINTWIDSNYWGLYQMKTPDGKVHGNYNQAGTGTGRYSCNNPNLLNLPSKKKNSGKNDVRKIVVSRYGDDGVICDPDFSQIELRILLEVSKSIKGIEDYSNGIDLHTSKAQWAINHYMGEGTWESGTDYQRKAWRDQQKAVNFGLVYGLSPKDDLQQAMFDAFYKDYPEVADWQEEVRDRIKSLGYYKSPITQYEYNFEGATQANFYRGYSSDGRGWKNKAMNFPIQGDAGRIAQAAMIGIYRDLKKEGVEGVHMFGQVYDEIILDVHKDKLDIAKRICLNNMNGVDKLVEQLFGYKLEIPIEATWSYGPNWFDTEEM